MFLKGLCFKIYLAHKSNLTKRKIEIVASIPKKKQNKIPFKGLTTGSSISSSTSVILWVRRCCFRFPLVVNPLSQTQHANGLSFV